MAPQFQTENLGLIREPISRVFCEEGATAASTLAALALQHTFRPEKI